MHHIDSRPAAVFLVAGPSSVGKDTLVRRLIEDRPELMKPITTTTRPPRDYEIDGIHYHFLTPEAFRDGIQQGRFLEHAVIHGNYYGLSRAALAHVRKQGRLPIAILDVQGVRSVAAQLPVVTAFIRAPLDQIEARIRKFRPAGEIESRMAIIRRELAEASSYDCVVENPDGRLDEAYAMLLNFYDTVARQRLERFARTVSVAVRSTR